MNWIKILCLGILFYTATVNAQTCGTCTLNITAMDTTAYTISTGQTLCIDTTGNYTGNIIIAGGTVCNKGFFNPKSISFQSGSINNYSSSNLKLNVTVSSGASIVNGDGAILGVAGSLTLSGGTLLNSGIMNVEQSVTNSSGSFTNSNILNCRSLTGNNTLTNTGVINSN